MHNLEGESKKVNLHNNAHGGEDEKNMPSRGIMRWRDGHIKKKKKSTPRQEGAATRKKDALWLLPRASRATRSPSVANTSSARACREASIANSHTAHTSAHTHTQAHTQKERDGHNLPSEQEESPHSPPRNNPTPHHVTRNHVIR